MKRKRVIVVVMGLGLAIGVVTAAFFTAGGTKSTDTRSSVFSDDQAKIEFLKRYLKMHSEIDATEFHIRYQDNSGLVPGPSDWDMQVVIKMPKDRLDRWTTDLQKTNQADLSWAYDLLPKEERWTIRSKPTLYHRGQTVVAVFESEGIVFKRTKSP